MQTTCSDIEPLLTPYVDGEAAAPDRACLEAHLAVCPSCRALVEAERRCRELLRAHREALTPSPSPALRARCAGLAGGGRQSAFRRWAPLSMAATLVLAVAGVLLLGSLGPGARVGALAAELADDHVNCFMQPPAPASPLNPVQVADEWMSQHGWRLTVPAASSGEDLELVGLRRCRFSGGHLGHLLYRHAGRPVSVFVIQQQAVPRAALEIGDHEAVIWSRAGRTYAVVAGEPRPRVERIATYISEQIH
jgi:anti-sigma factor RsiW